MKRGKKICQTLKDIRLQVAQANEIPYEPTECKHKGDCSGTCPKCEEEVRYIEHQLNVRRMMGKAVTMAGVAMSVYGCATNKAIVQNTTTILKDSTAISALQTLKVKSLLNEGEQGFVLRGRILDGDGEPCIGTLIKREDNRTGEVSNLDGMFAVEVPEGCKLTISLIGYVDQALVASSKQPVVEIKLKDDAKVLQGEVVILKKVNDDVYGRRK